MINFCLTIYEEKQGVYCSSMPQRPEGALLCHLFSSGVALSYFKTIQHQLKDIEQGKKTDFDSNDKDIPSRNESLFAELSVQSMKWVQMSLTIENKHISVSLSEFKEWVDNWIKFVEINTKAFGKKEKK